MKNETMKSFPFLALAFFLLCVSTMRAETPFVLESAWVVGSNEWFASIFKDANLEFPEEIAADAAWHGATVTDGKTIMSIILLPLKNETFSMQRYEFDFVFRAKLLSHAVVAQAFPDGMFQMAKRDSTLYLISPELVKTETNEFKMIDYWNYLFKKSFIGIIQKYPERILLPTLPPEQEDESPFVKRVRKRSADDYRDGEYVGKTDSVFMGIRYLDPEWSVIYEVDNVDGTATSDDTESPPFSFGGFVASDATYNMAYRIGKENIEDQFFVFKVGTRVIPLEERQGAMKREFKLSAAVCEKKPEEEGDTHLINDDNFFVFYPKQSENRPEEDGIPSNAELDKMNEELARNFIPVLANVRQALLASDWSQPFDFAVLGEDEFYYLALAYPSVATNIDGNLTVQFIQAVTNYFQQTGHPDDDCTFRMETKGTSKTTTGLVCHRRRISFSEYEVLVIFIHESGIFYAVALPLENFSGDVFEEQYETMQQRLEQKITASQLAVAEKMKPPITICRFNRDGVRWRVNYETTERGYRYTAYAAPNSLRSVLTFVENFGIVPTELIP